MRKYIPLLTFIITAFLISGCTIIKLEEEKLQDLEYTIVTEDQQPEVVQMLIQESKEENMKVSYTDQGTSYIVVGYGEQKTSGYSVEVLDVYETENTIYINTNLLGPSSNEEVADSATYPYIVIAIDETEKPIVYD